MISKDNNKKKLFILYVLLVLIIIFIIFLVIYNIFNLKKYDNIILPSSYLEGVDLSYVSYDDLDNKLDYYNEEILEQNINFKINSKYYQYTLNDLGISINKDKTINNIKKSQNDIRFISRIDNINGNNTSNYNIYFDIDKDKILSFLKSIESTVNCSVIDGYFDTSDGVVYHSGTDGFTLNIDDSLDLILDYFSNDFDLFHEIELIGDVVSSSNNDSYSKIDTMTSSFVTKFDTWVTARVTNLKVALNYINGAIIEPGEVFSYYKYAGPYDKSGYVFYYEFVGNGVCQIATTVYDAALLGGLEIVKRYPHAKKSVYVDGGLDATVASYSSGWNVDFQFKNTYSYPIYIKAYAVGGEAHVEFWSNSESKEGKTYSTESVKLGSRHYKTYLHTYKDGEEIDKSFIAETWYTEE
jgi:vancomycin resistance protein YoaR